MGLKGLCHGDAISDEEGLRDFSLDGFEEILV